MLSIVVLVPTLVLSVLGTPIINRGAMGEEAHAKKTAVASMEKRAVTRPGMPTVWAVEKRADGDGTPDLWAVEKRADEDGTPDLWAVEKRADEDGNPDLWAVEKRADEDGNPDLWAVEKRADEDGTPDLWAVEKRASAGAKTYQAKRANYPTPQPRRPDA